MSMENGTMLADEVFDSEQGSERAVRQHAEQCQLGFLNILHGVHRDDRIIGRLHQLFRQPSDAKPIYTINDVRDEFEQFRVWTSNIGVFASDHASLDYRLREAIDVKHGIVDLLNSLNADLVESLALLKADRVYEDDVQRQKDDSGDESCSDSDLEDLSDMEITVYELQGRVEHISDTITKLMHLARAIRTSGVRSRTVKASNFVHYDDDGINQTELFEGQFLPNVLQYRYQVPESLLKRFCHAISLRRRRFMFYRRHQKRLAAYNTDTAEGLSAPPPLSDPPAAPQEEEVRIHKVPNLLPLAPVQAQSEVTHRTYATTFSPHQYHKAAPSTMVASTAKIAMGSTEIPPAPRPAADGSHFECPYCCLLVENKKTSPVAWRKHIINDLQPFICIEPSCKDPNVILESWTDWLEHHKWTHAMEWWCEGVDNDHDPAKFASAGQYSEHLLISHMSMLSIREVEKKLNTSGRPSEEPFRFCPFCSFRSDAIVLDHSQDAWTFARKQQNILQSHIFDHLLSFFLLALPERDDFDDVTSDKTSSAILGTSMNTIFDHHSGHSSVIGSVSQSPSRQEPVLPRPPRSNGSQSYRFAESNHNTGIDHRELIWKNRRAPKGLLFGCPWGCKYGFADTADYSGHINSSHLEFRLTDNKDLTKPAVIHKANLILDLPNLPSFQLDLVDLSGTGKEADSSSWVYLATATTEDYIEVLQRLTSVAVTIGVQKSADIDVALQKALNGGFDGAVEILIAAGARISAQGGRYGNSLHTASFLGHVKVVQVLLAAGADVNAQGGYYGSALQAASLSGSQMISALFSDDGDVYSFRKAALHCQQVVQNLVAAGANVNAQGGHFGNALQAAASCCHEKVVQILMAAGANVNTQGGYFGNALQAASSCGHELETYYSLNGDIFEDPSSLYAEAERAGFSCFGNRLVPMLIAAGASVNAQGGYYGNALQAASFFGHEKAVQALIAAGADVNAQGGQYRNALNAASLRNNEKVMQILIAAGADPEAQGEQQQKHTPSLTVSSSSGESRAPSPEDNARDRMVQLRILPCAFHHFGCRATFSDKNEWKRHVQSRHLRLYFYRCDLARCNPQNRSEPHTHEGYTQLLPASDTRSEVEDTTSAPEDARPKQNLEQRCVVVLKYGKQNRRAVERLLKLVPRPLKLNRLDEGVPQAGSLSLTNSVETATEMYKDFNRADLFMQHCRRVHGPSNYRRDNSTATNQAINARLKSHPALSKLSENALISTYEAEFEEELKTILSRCRVRRHKAPSKTGCGFCERKFEAESYSKSMPSLSFIVKDNMSSTQIENEEDLAREMAWEARMDHVAVHYFRDGAVPADERIDDDLVEWGLSVGVLRNIVVDDGKVVPWLPYSVPISAPPALSLTLDALDSAV